MTNWCDHCGGRGFNGCIPNWWICHWAFDDTWFEKFFAVKCELCEGDGRKLPQWPGGAVITPRGDVFLNGRPIHTNYEGLVFSPPPPPTRQKCQSYQDYKAETQDYLDRYGSSRNKQNQ